MDFRDKEQIDSVRKTDANEASRFSGGDVVRAVLESRELALHRVGQIWSYGAPVKAPETSRRDIATEKGFRACLCSK